MEKETFGQWLRGQRQKKELTLRELAKELDIKYPYLSQIELYNTTPSEDLAKTIAKFFGSDEESVVFLARDVKSTILDIKKKYPEKAKEYFIKEV